MISYADAGLETFLQLTNKDLVAPQIMVDTESINLRLQSEEIRTIQIRISKHGRGYLFGSVEFSQVIKGLALSGVSFGIDQMPGQATVIETQIDSAQMVPGKKHRTTILINSNAGNGQIAIPVSIEVYRSPLASATALWLGTLPLAILFSVLFYNYLSYEFAGDALMSTLGPFFTIASGFIGLIVYNYYWSNSAKGRDNHIGTYFLSLLVFFGFAIAGFIIMFVLIAILVIVGIGVALWIWGSSK